MTAQSEHLIGTQVTGSDGHQVGVVDEVFRDDADGTPSWVRIRSGEQERLVPLNGSSMTMTGLNVPFDSPTIAAEPAIDVDQHMSAAQEDELRGYFGLTGRAPASAGQRGDVVGEGDPGWLVLTEERVEVGTEVVEAGRVRLRKYAETSPIERVVRVFREEYEVEHVPIRPGERVDGPDGDGGGEQELVLHEERAVFMKEAVPVERVRLAVRRVEEDRTFRGEVRKERVELAAEPAADQGPQSGYQ